MADAARSSDPSYSDPIREAQKASEAPPNPKHVVIWVYAHARGPPAEEESAMRRDPPTPAIPTPF
eukprot:5674312-Pyramimonas_sp.AAC.1